MSIYGIGVDLINHTRIQSLYAKYGDRFARRILDDDEMILFQDTENKERYLCNAFAMSKSSLESISIAYFFLSS